MSDDTMRGLFDALNPAKLQEMIAACTVYRSRWSKSHTFATAAEAEAFDAGWNGYFDGYQCPSQSPGSLGWLIAERTDDMRREARTEEREYERERRDAL